MTSSLQKSFISIIRLGIDHYKDALFGPVDWNEIQTLAERQGLAAVLVDGIEKLPDNLRPPKDGLLQMIGQVVQGYEYRYELYRRAIAELAGFYREHGLKMMVLKGYACSLDWPKPEHRPCGDIDIWLFGKQKESDALLESEKHIKVDKSHHHHTVFCWRDFMVENHYDFINTHRNKPNADQELILKQLGVDDSHSIEIYGEKVCIPSPHLNAFFLIRHLMGHFASSEITLRQVLDWAFFVDKHTGVLDWEWLLSLLNDYHMVEFLNLINAICVDDLGFSSESFPAIKFKPEVKERVLHDILDPAYGTAEPSEFIDRMIYKFRRWKANSWKHKLCYEESLFSSFWNGVCNHLLKPSSI